ncbi:MAG TPA: transcription antitermination factor NusB [Bacillales bacterium]|nr:transcription antitermination factor NusB [Bacillales bacterium]
MNRRTARQKAVQSLFQIDISGTEPTAAIANVLEEDERADPFLESLVNGTLQHLQDIDPLIEKHLEHWNMKRIGNVDRCILRMAVFELGHMEDIPRNVTLNEAVELAKMFGGEESSRFVNGVLSKIAKQKGEEYDGGNH